MTSHRTPPRLALALCALALGAVSLSPTAAAQQKPAKKAVKLKWPKLTTKQKGALSKALRQLRADEEEVRDTGHEAIGGIGAGAVPNLFLRLADNNEPAKNEICAAMRQLIEKRHAPLIAKYAVRKQVDVRRFTVEQLAKCFAPAQLPVLEKALADKDADVRFYAALGLAGIGEFRAMDTVFDRCKTEWRGMAPDVDQVLRTVRSQKTADWVLHKMRDADDLTVITGLRLLRSLAPKDYAGLIKPYLDSSQNAIMKEAINALRVVVDSQEPLENLSVFQLIEMVKQWKAKI